MTFAILLELNSGSGVVHHAALLAIRHLLSVALFSELDVVIPSAMILGSHCFARGTAGHRSLISAQMRFLTPAQDWRRLQLEPAVVGELELADTDRLLAGAITIPAMVTGIFDWNRLLLLSVRSLTALAACDQGPNNVDDEDYDPYLPCTVQEAWDSLELGSSSGGEVFAEVAGTE